jgi:hypothetical protein
VYTVAADATMQKNARTIIVLFVKNQNTEVNNVGSLRKLKYKKYSSERKRNKRIKTHRFLVE